MSKRKFAMGMVAVLCVAVLLIGQVFSQAGGGRRAGGVRAAGGMRGRDFNVEEMRQRMMERMKTALEADDAQWSKMEPLLTKVMELQRELRSGGRFGMFGRVGFGGRGGFVGGRGAGAGQDRGPAAGQGRGPVGQGRGPGAGQGRGPAGGQGRGPGTGQARGPRGDRPDRPQTDIQKKSQALQELLANMLTEPAQIQKQLEELRAAKKKVQAELEKNRQGLAKIVTPRQEARLVLMGYLE